MPAMIATLPPSLSEFIDAEYAQYECYPPREKIFAALELTPPERTKVVILGQDPYHEPGQAQGLAFYVPPECKTPPSLRNIAKELGGMPDLMSWAKQGVLLLNTTLTVRKGEPMSHVGHGWEEYTDAIISNLNVACRHLVFMLWGAHAQKKGAQIDETKHLVLRAAHPSPLSAHRGFFGCNHFKLANDYLREHGIEEIKWL